MSNATPDHIDVEALPEGDVVRILLEQHEHIRELCAAMAVTMSTEQKSMVFNELRALLAVHEAGEEAVVRPTTLITAGEAVVDLRNAEEKAAAQALTELETLPIDSTEFDEKFAELAESVAAHADAEESEEFARLLETCDDQERSRLGTLLLQAEKLAPVHPHPALAGSPIKQQLVGPFAALFDHVRDLFARSSS